MNNFLEKSKKYLTLFLVAAIAFITVSSSPKAVAETIEAGEGEDLAAYISTKHFATKRTTDGGYLYCLEMIKSTTRNTTLTYSGVRDAGIAEIVKNGFPNKSFTGDNLKDYYITQTAIWWYLDEAEGQSNLNKEFKSTGSDVHNMRHFVKELVDLGLQARERGYQSTNVEVSTANDRLTNDGNYYVSDVINVNTNAADYTVSLNGATTGTKIVGANSGEEKTTFSNEGFIIKIPASEITDSNLTITVNVTANGVIYKAYEYTPATQEMQKVTPADIKPEEDKVSTSINLSLITSKVTVTKYDSETEQPLAGAKLVLKNSKGEVVDTWTTTTNAYTIRNLANGTYTVSEEEAPTGYRLSSDVVEFKISNDADDVTVKFYNTPKEETVVNITKIDAETGNALAGATLVVKDTNGKEVAKFVTTDESKVITGLAYGTYTVSEESAPAGFKKSDEVIEFTLDDDHISYQIRFANYKEVIVPNTSTNSLLFTILGIAIIGSGLGFVYKNGKKTK